MVAHAFVQPLAIFPNVHLMPQTTYVLPSEESQQIFTIFNAALFRHHAERGIVDLRRDFRCRRAANARGGRRLIWRRRLRFP